MFPEMIWNDGRCRSMVVAMAAAAKQAFELCWSVGPRLRELLKFRAATPAGESSS